MKTSNLYAEKNSLSSSFYQSVTRQWSVNSVKELEGIQIFILLQRYIKAKGLTMRVGKRCGGGCNCCKEWDLSKVYMKKVLWSAAGARNFWTFRTENVVQWRNLLVNLYQHTRIPTATTPSPMKSYFKWEKNKRVKLCNIFRIYPFHSANADELTEHI